MKDEKEFEDIYKFQYTETEQREFSWNKSGVIKVNGRRFRGVDYNELVVSQDGVCAICGQEETSLNSIGNIKKLSVDHSHETGIVRELLCSRCNAGLGFFKEDPTLFLKAYKYINKHKVSEEN